jgi:Domain of unknown function (DUF4190)
MTNPGGDSSETPASDTGSGSSEPSSSGFEAPPIEESQPSADAGDQTQRAPLPKEQFAPPGNTPPSSGYEAPSGYQPPADYQQAGYPPPTYPSEPAYPPPPPSYYPTPGAQQQGYPPPYPDQSAYGGQPNYGGQPYPPPPPPQYGGAPGYPPPSSYPAPGYPAGYSGGYGQQPQPETNQLAIWSLVASLVGILCTIGSLVGIALGVIALNQIKERREGGHGLAIAGIGVGVATLIISIIWTAFAFST